MKPDGDKCVFRKLTRREFLLASLVTGFAAGTGYYLGTHKKAEVRTEVFIAKMGNYNSDVVSLIRAGLHELDVIPEEINGKRILLKPNLVEPQIGTDHICTHPLIVKGTAEVFLQMGARQVVVAEGSGHCTDAWRILEESGLEETLLDDHIPFIDLNNDDFFITPNLGGRTSLQGFALPSVIKKVDWIVSMPKLKTHHWAGVTLSMKNLFGIMPGIIYGWPKNVLHHAGIIESILDINATIKPHFAIVDGVMGMDGDGPIMGMPHHAGVLVMGRNLAAVDATCARIMGINPQKIGYLKASSSWLGSIREKNIVQLGEKVSSVRTDFALIDKIPAHKGLRL